MTYNVGSIPAGLQKERTTLPAAIITREDPDINHVRIMSRLPMRLVAAITN